MLILTARAKATEVTVYDSVVSLSVNTTTNYTFNDPTNGLGVVVTVTMTPYSSLTNNPTFTLLDGNTHLGVESGQGGGDGNWVDNWEGADFTATLLSVSNGIVTNSVRFGITGIGIRPEGGPIFWTSSITTNSFTVESESLATLDSNLALINTTTYAGALRIASGDNRIQISDAGVLAGQSFAISAYFIEGDGSPVIVQNPSDQDVCEGNNASFISTADGDPSPTVQWQVQTNGGNSFLDVSGATNTTLDVSSSQSDSGSLYRAVFTNAMGGATTTVAMLSVFNAPSPLITAGSTNVMPISATNTAAAVPGASGYKWTISNGSIIGSSTSTGITYSAGISGFVTLQLSVSNAIGCVSSSSVAVAIAPLSGVTGGEGVYVSDDGSYIYKFGANGVGSIFAITNLIYPQDLVFDRSGNLYVANYDSGMIVKFDTNGSDTIYASGLNGPVGLAIDGAGDLFVSEYDSNSIRKVATNGTVTLFTDVGLNSPTDIAFDRAGYLYVASSSDGIIYKFDPEGVGSLVDDGFNEPYGLAFDNEGNLFVSDFDIGEIWKIPPGGSGTLFTNTPTSPVGLAFDRAGNLYVSDETVVRKFSPDGNSSIFANAGLTYAEFIAIWPMPSQVIPVNPAAFSASVSTNQIEFAVSGSIGIDYITQASTNLLEPDWITLSTNTSPYIFIDTNTSAYGERYYRAINTQ